MTLTPTETAANSTSRVPEANALRPLPFSDYLAASRGTLVVLSLAVFATFLPVIIVPYAFSDDYPLLWMAVSGEPNALFGDNILSANAVGGRPFAGLIQTAFFSAADTIDHLRLVRLVGVLAIVALGLLLHWALVRARIGTVVAALIALLICGLPAFQVYAAWTTMFVAPLAALIGGGASLLALAAVDAPASSVADRVVGATAMLLGSLLIYQPAAMVYWVFLAVAIVGAAPDWARTARLAKLHFGIAAVALALAFLVERLGVRIAGDEAPNATRGTLTHDPGGKLAWFFEDPLKRSLNLFDLTPSLWLAVLVGAVALLGMTLLLLRRGARPLPYLMLAAVLVPLAYLPNLVTKQNSATYRTQVALSSLLALYAALGVLGISLSVGDRLRPRITRTSFVRARRAAYALAGALVGLSAISATWNVTTLFADPQMTELRLIRGQVAALPEGTSRVAFPGTSYLEGMAPLVIGDEFGLPSTSHVFVAEPIVRLLLREQGRLPPNGPEPVVETFWWYENSFPKGEPVIDVRRQLRAFR